MITLRKLLFFVFLFFVLIHSYALAEEKKSGWVDATVNTANNAGNNDGLQQLFSDTGKEIAKTGQHIVNKAVEFGQQNPNLPGSNVDSVVKTGVRVISNGKVIENVAILAPHVAWIASTAGKLDAGDRTGAVITATNGLGRTIAVGWVAGTLGTLATGAVATGAAVTAGPIALGFVVGCGVAYGAGKIWDYTIGSGAEVLDQKVHDLKAGLSYGQTPLASAQRNIRKLKWSPRKKVDNTMIVLPDENIETGEGSVDHETKGKDQSASAKKKKLKEKNKEREEAKKQAEKIRKKVKEQLVKKEKEAQRKKAEEARERLKKKIAESKKRNLAAKAKKLLEKSQKRDREAEAKSARERLREKIEQSKKENYSDKKKKYVDMNSNERHKALKNNNDEAWEELTEQLIKDLGLTQDQEEKIAKLSGVISGGWAGKDKDGWKARGIFRMRISPSGRISGKYSGDASGSMRGFINSSGQLDVKSGGGSVSGGRWSGSIRKSSSGGLNGSGSWNAEGYRGGWRGSGK